MTYKYIGFTFSNGEPMPVTNGTRRGYWEFSDGGEGGELHIDVQSKEVTDFDGHYDLPSYVKAELRAAGYIVDF